MSRRVAIAPRRLCAWCDAVIRPSARRDALCCSVRCRQARHRFGAGAPRAATLEGPARRFAYADPPYPGLAKRYYRHHRDYAGEVDHAKLVARLVREFPDGWALSTSARSLRDVLSLCPSEVRIAAWVRGERPVKSYSPLQSWDPVIYCGGRPMLPSDVDARRVDSLVHVARPRLTDPNRVIGAKPAEFCWWLFKLLGALPGDELVDVFPGSGGIARAWAVYESRSPAATTQVTAPRDASLRSSATRRDQLETEASPAAARDGLN